MAKDTYRIRIPAGLYFDVIASSPEEAITKANQVRDNFSEGLEIDADEYRSSERLHMIAYFNDDDQATIENVDNIAKE